MHPLRILLRESIDYAGLFPPAGLDMAPAVANYAAYRAGPAAWALGRFVLPAARLAEFETAAAGLLPAAPSAEPWKLSALVGPDLAGDLRTVGEFNCRHAAEGAGAVIADVVELKAGSPDAVEQAMAGMPGFLQAYLEIPVDRDPAELVAAIGRLGGRAKVRTGGVTPDAFPATHDLVRFLRRCVGAGVRFKATAGLHHPLRGRYRLTYEPGAPAGTMFGFLNLFVAAAWVRHGLGDVEAAALLEESEPAALGFDDGGVIWRGRRLETAALQEAREGAIVSFGSCSFTEPLDDLATHRLL